MAGKMEPEEAFRLIDHRGVKNRAVAPGETIAENDPEQSLNETPKEKPKWLRYLIISITATLALGFFGILAYGIYLIYDKKEFIPTELEHEERLVTFSEAEIKDLITERLRNFLNSVNTKQRMKHVLMPKTEQKAMYDYYEQRGNLDAGLWKIEVIDSVNIGGTRIWMVAYRDLNKIVRYIRFERWQNSFYIQWSSSYAYGQLPWNKFAISQPSEPVQMRCFILRHTGTSPPGVNPATHMVFVIENKRGEFTSTAVMNRNSDGFRLLARLPIGARSPVNLKLKYTDFPDGTRQLTIERLIHFQWHQNTTITKGIPVELR